MERGDFEREVLARLDALVAAVGRLDARLARLEAPTAHPGPPPVDTDPYAVKAGP